MIHLLSFWLMATLPQPLYLGGLVQGKPPTCGGWGCSVEVEWSVTPARP
nr:MAG TPA: hypothetical protein [Caudoviricetes sp.]